MPPPALSNLVEKFILLTRIPSWPIASLLIGTVYYLLFAVLAYLDGLMQSLIIADRWWQTLLMPVTGTYLLLIQPLLRTQLTHTIDAYRKIVPFNDRLKRLETNAYTLNRRGEWVALAVGTLLGWFLLDSPLIEGYLSGRIYEIIGDVFVFGLIGWHIYAALTRTRLLSVIHDQVQHLTIFRQSVSYRQTIIWSVLNAGVFIAGILASSVFLRPEDFFQRDTLIIYGTLIVSALLVFAFSRVPASILNQFRVFRAFFLFAMVAVIGTIGYNRLERWDADDALYATIITMTTIGYGDLSPVTPEGRIFTIFLSLFAIGIGGYAVTSLASFVIEGNFTRIFQGRRVDKKIVRMRDHYIVCGAGSLGRHLAIEFYKSRVPFVVIEQTRDTLEGLLHEVEIPYVQGDATQDESLRLAGVERAKGLVAALSDDKENVFITLSARALNPELRIISRLSVEKNRQKLLKAGANDVISPNAVSGRRMASEMLYSEVVTLLDEMLQAEQQTGQTLRLEEVYVNQIKIPALVERLNRGDLHINDIGQRTELMVVAIKRARSERDQDPYIYTPRGTTRLERGDVLIVIGTPEQRIKLQHDVLSSNDMLSWLGSLRN
jgi:voltage-gated potassium channel